MYLVNFSFQSKNEEFQLWRCHQKILDLVYPLNLLNFVLNICFNEIGLKLKSTIRRNADVIEAVARYNYPDNLKVVKCTSNDPQLPLWLGTFVHSMVSQTSWP